MERTLNLSVHGLVDFLLRRGSIDSRVFNNATMLEGTRIHLRYQSIQNGNYLSEVYLEESFNVDDFEVMLSGRADGIIVEKDRVTIDEIKSTVADLETFFEEQGEWHLAQAKCYALMFANQNDLKKISCRLTYISQIDNSKLIKSFSYSREKLEEEVINLIKEYLEFYRRIDTHKKRIKESSNQLEFPYPTFREGQHRLAKFTYKIAQDGGLLFAEAPTGIGKTMSTLFPAIKSFAEEKNDKIFYLAAKSSQKGIAFDALKVMIEKGLVIKAIKLTAKEKMCQNDVSHCNPDECPFARNYYDKLRIVLQEMLNDEDLYDENYITTIAYQNAMCAFELQLDLSLFTDVIICDYNYVFDPMAYLKRYFDEVKEDYLALIDEAHNLVDRSREMYSTSLDLNSLIFLRQLLKKEKLPKLKRHLKKLINHFEQTKEKEEIYQIQDGDFSLEFYAALDNYFKASQDTMKENQNFSNEKFSEIFKDVNKFLKLREFVCDDFVTYFEKIDDNVVAHIRCLDSSRLISDSLKKLRGAVFFSATLTPRDYYIRLLGGDETSPYISLDSPFPKENLLLLIRGDISTRLKDRPLSYRDIANSIKVMVNAKVGNYLVFFPSFAYLEEVYRYFEDDEYFTLKQTRDMKESERAEFLNRFVLSPKETMIGFAVLGGAFSEGIDLSSDRLIGAVIVGVGLPTISFERDLLKEHFNNNGEEGYDYAYTNPGMNKVMQAAGRVIRSATDRGVVMLIDSRFLYQKYREMFKKEWSHYKRVYSIEEISEEVQKFWNS